MPAFTKLKTIFLLIVVLFISFTGCFRIKSSKGGGQIDQAIQERIFNAGDVALPEGYKIEVVATGLTYPTGIAFDDAGDIYVTESGYAYGEEWTTPQLKRIASDGKTEVIATGGKNGPWNGVTYHEGAFYVAEGGQLEGGKILKITKEGEITPIVENLPSMGDHHTNGPVVKDSYIYFGQGTVTNSAVVGKDNEKFGWLPRNPELHDIPCKDITLIGKNYVTDNVLTDTPEDKVTTGAYSPYGKPTTTGQVIKGAVPCSGAIMRVPLGGGAVELVAWGFRNPYGLAYSPEGKLFITENAYDVRGSRPVWGTGDVLWEVEEGQWYGWPDFSAGENMAFKEDFSVPGEGAVEAVLATYPSRPPDPIAILGVHSSSNGLDFSESASFGYAGEAFIAQFGDMAPDVGKVLSPVGFKVVRVNVSNGVVSDFAVNKGKRNGPASWLKRGGLERPIAVSFDPSGEALYIVDFGIMRMTENGSQPVKSTGAVWKITRSEDE